MHQTKSTVNKSRLYLYFLLPPQIYGQVKIWVKSNTIPRSECVKIQTKYLQNYRFFQAIFRKCFILSIKYRKKFSKLAKIYSLILADKKRQKGMEIMNPKSGELAQKQY